MALNTVVYSHTDVNNLITTQKNPARIYSVKLLQSREMAEIEDLHPNLSTNLSDFTLKIGHRNLLFSKDFIGSHHDSSLTCYFPEIVSISEKICPNILKMLLIFNMFMTH